MYSRNLDGNAMNMAIEEESFRPIKMKEKMLRTTHGFQVGANDSQSSLERNFYGGNGSQIIKVQFENSL